MWKKVSVFILLIFPMLMLFQSSPTNVLADAQSSYYDITLTTNNNGGDGNGGNGGSTTDPGGNGNGSGTGNGNQTTNGNNGGSTQTTTAPGSTTASSQPKTALSGLLPQTNNLQEGLLLGMLVLIFALFTWVIYLLVEGKRREKNEEIN